MYHNYMKPAEFQNIHPLHLFLLNSILYIGCMKMLFMNDTLKKKKYVSFQGSGILNTALATTLILFNFKFRIINSCFPYLRLLEFCIT